LQQFVHSAYKHLQFANVQAEIGDFCRKLQNFPTPLVFCTPTEGVPIGIGYRRSGSKTKQKLKNRLSWKDALLSAEKEA